VPLPVQPGVDLDGGGRPGCHPVGRRRKLRAIRAATALVLAGVVVAGGGSAPAREGMTATELGTAALPRAAQAPDTAHATAASAAESPEAAAVAVRIPSLGVSSAIVPVALAPDRVLEPPADPQVVGWYTGGVVPGRQGSAVLAGHIDSHSGPGVFFRLADLRPGAVIEVYLSDHNTLRFRVVEVVRISKDEFPTDAVYGPVPVPQLRVISCAGRFDRRSGQYVDNVIVTAVLG
jgi:sortase (surface protein transpeptidase)